MQKGLQVPIALEESDSRGEYCSIISFCKLLCVSTDVFDVIANFTTIQLHWTAEESEQLNSNVSLYKGVMILLMLDMQFLLFHDSAWLHTAISMLVLFFHGTSFKATELKVWELY